MVKAKILVVEDDSAISNLIRTTLETQNYQYHTAKTGSGALLDAEQHYTVCHYMRCRSCGALYFVGACIRGAPVFRQVADIRKENLDTRLWGRCGTYYLQKKD